MTAIPSIRPATPDDFESLLEIRKEIAVDLLQRGIASNPNALRRHHLEEWTAAEALWVADRSRRSLGSIAVWFHDPTNYWSGADLASYVRDLMVHPRHRHKGFGAVMLGWAERFSVGQGAEPGQARLRGLERATLPLLQGRRATATSITDKDGFALFEKVLH